MKLVHRMRRLRTGTLSRELFAETRLSPSMLMYPFFVTAGNHIRHEIASMPGIAHLSIDNLLREVETCLSLGIRNILLFGVNEPKSEFAAAAQSAHSIVPEAVRALKKSFGDDLYIATDVCLCAYTTHGHCGVLEHGLIVNDASLPLLATMALRHAEAGADMVAPSDMMDGRVGAIRNALDEAAFEHTALMSYSVKFASSYYGPFREAANSAPQQGNRKSYQMDIRNAREALRAAALDEQEGADMLMVKPALAFLDIIKSVRQTSLLPLACYNVSGEYAMVKAAAQNGWLDEAAVVRENLYAFARAGADLIITYHAKDALQYNWID
ncbi:MAG: porphobilinogen synthase [Sphingobacteriales bacterium]|nr:porphobilinogen synthase [Sphingobacteriales bacterium]